MHKFIIVKVASVSQDDMEQAEILGKDTFEDEQVEDSEMRVMLDKIESWDTLHGDINCTQINFVSGGYVFAQESVEEIDKKILSANAHFN